MYQLVSVFEQLPFKTVSSIAFIAIVSSCPLGLRLYMWLL